MKETMTAEEMFIELDFMFIYESDDVLEFSKTNKGGRDIVGFIKKSKEVECYDENEKDMSKKPLFVDGKLLLAINKQFEEWGWIE